VSGWIGLNNWAFCAIAITLWFGKISKNLMLLTPIAAGATFNSGAAD
jgi:hypothetical protein